MEIKNFGIREKIIAGFLLLIIIFGLNGVYNLVTINSSQKTLWIIINDHDPAIKVLNEFNAEVSKCINTGSGIVHNDINHDLKGDLIELSLQESKKALLTNSVFWDRSEEKSMLSGIFTDLDSLILSFRILKSYKLNQTINGDSMAEIIYEQKIIPVANKIIDHTDVLIKAKETEKERAKNTLTNSFGALKNGIFTLGVLIILICIAISVYTSYTVLKQINNISQITQDLSEGILPPQIEKPGNDEVGLMAKAINRLISGLNQTTTFAKNIGDGSFDTTFTPLSENDILGNSLINMRDNLKKVNEEDKLRNWANEGYAKFSDLLRHNYETRIDLANNILSYLVKYVNANQGMFFIVNQENGEEYLEEIATYAWDRKKYIDAKYKKGEGLAGQAWIENDSIFLTEVPQDFVYIKSGIGMTCPKCVFVVPLVYNDTTYGVIELASLAVFTPSEKDFILKVSENIAATLSNALTAYKMKNLLDETQSKTLMLREQEEEMRQNLEELESTQEDMKKTEKELNKRIKELISENESMRQTIQELTNKSNQ